MAFKRFQNIVAESRLILPFASLVAIGACYMTGLVADMLWMQLVCLILSTYLMFELNRSNQLLRVHSQMVSSMFLLLVCASIFLFPDLRTEILELCMIALYIMLFHCYQQRRASGWVFYGFFCLGLASMVFVQVLYYVPILWILMYHHLRTMSMKTFCASLLGIVTPYWFVSVYYLYLGEFSFFSSHFGELGVFAPLWDYSAVTEQQYVAFGWTALMALIGIIHYLSQGYHDKTRTRMLYGMLMVLDLLTILFLVLQPQHYSLLMPIIIVTTAPLIAHYMTLTHSWYTNLSFSLIILITLAITAYHIWMPSSNFLSATVMSACSYLHL
ncbi:MAG: hypothetical protein J5682_03080 [Prevotella sp.]|nr:hypothetical protein [Prevotella sp.]